MEIKSDNFETGCCKRFDPASWDKKTITFENRLFVKDRVCAFFHIPFNFGGVMNRNMRKIEKAGALANDELRISDENSLWGSDLYIAVDKEVPGALMSAISGTFLTRVFEGPYKNMGKWIEEMKKYVASKKKTMKKLYFYYTTCPACAKAYGKNYTVLLAGV